MDDALNEMDGYAGFYVLGFEEGSVIVTGRVKIKAAVAAAAGISGAAAITSHVTSAVIGAANQLGVSPSSIVGTYGKYFFNLLILLQLKPRNRVISY